MEYFGASETVNLRLDNATTGTIVGTATSNALGAASAITVTIPAATSNGAHTIYAVGATSAKQGSIAITVALPTISLSSATIVNLPGSTNATLANFGVSETVTFRLDDASTGASLGSSTTTSAGALSAFAITVPAGTSNGSHTVYAVGGTSAKSASIAITVDIASLSLGTTSFATLTGTTTASASNFSATETVTFRLDNSSTGTSLGTTPMSSGAGSRSLTIPTNLTNGAHTVYAIGGTSGKIASAAFTVTAAEATNAAASPLLITNKGGAGSTSRQAEVGDTITVSFDSRLRPASICSGWSDANTTSTQSITTASVVLNGTGTNSTISITGNPTGCTTFNFGTIDLGRSDFTNGANTTFASSTVAWDPVNKQIKITLGTVSGTNNTVRAPNGITATATFTQSANLLSEAGASVSGTWTFSGQTFF
ncbi:unannotated protein [freshwater metagenome]|uniref:Unannotated protein n=1 Tax=freshwater metagenome TaxID=449393 RepID=A0A6J7EA56_9ZZZZ